MALINTNGLVLIGPGSEWFWTPISGVVLAITFLAIYRQLRLQRDGAAIAQLNDIEHEWSSERLARAKLTLLLALEAGAGPDDLPNRAVSEVGFFWQRVGNLVRHGHVDGRLVCEHLGDQVQAWAFWLRPPWQDFVWLARFAARMDVKRGLPGAVDPTELRETIPLYVAHFRDAVAMFEAMRTVTVRLTPVPVPVTSYPGEAAEAAS